MLSPADKSGTKRSLILDLLGRGEGASLQELMTATGMAAAHDVGGPVPHPLERAGAGEAAELDRLAATEPRACAAAGAWLRGTKPGTLLVREWESTLHRVMVLEQSFAWNGQTYDSLSQVARAITGTNWNEPRFFGLRERVGVPMNPATKPLRCAI